MYVTRISRFIYIVRYYPRFHVTAVGLGTYYRGYGGTPVPTTEQELTRYQAAHNKSHVFKKHLLYQT
jgi:hypothetical protein